MSQQTPTVVNPADLTLSGTRAQHPQIQRGNTFPLQAQHHDTEFRAGNLLIFSKLKIKLDPANGYDFEGRIPPAEPPLIQKKTWSLPVGIAIDSYASMLDAEVSQVMGAACNANYEVSLQLVDHEPGWELVDSLERPISWDKVRFDPEFDNMEKLQELFAQLRNSKEEWDYCKTLNYSNEMRFWRKGRRYWEICVLVHEWNRGNWKIFPPGTTKEDVDAAVMDLRQQESDDCTGAPRAIY